MRQIKTNDTERVETGPLQINDDWCGLFVRGDDCMTLHMILGHYLEYLKENNKGYLWTGNIVEPLMRDIEIAVGPDADYKFFPDPNEVEQIDG